FFVGNESTTWPILRSVEELGISALTSEQQELSRKISRKMPDCFETSSWRHYSRSDGTVPLATDAAVLMIGRIVQETPAGDHSFVLMELTELVDNNKSEPLIFHDRQFTTVNA